jgi:hypothetical protein
VTVTLAVPDFPSLVAVIVALPAATAVASPVPDTVAAAVLLDAHVIVRPVSVFPDASFSVAVNCCVPPACSDADAGDSVTVATGACTVMLDVPVFPSLVAVMVAVPAATAVTRPELDVVATLLLLVDHVTVRPVSTFPDASLSVTESCCVFPTARLADVGLTVTVATGACVTVIEAESFSPSLVA